MLIQILGINNQTIIKTILIIKIPIQKIQIMIQYIRMIIQFFGKVFQ